MASPATKPVVRAAQPSDYPTFVRLFPELAVDDPLMEPEKFAPEVVPTMLVAESSESSAASGYAHFQQMNGVVYVRHLVTAPEARRSGVAQALLAAIAHRARNAGCTTWCLNVKPDNVAAIALYERVGMTRRFTSKAVNIAWAAVGGADSMQDARIAARLIEPADDVLVEPALKLMNGQLAT